MGTFSANLSEGKVANFNPAVQPLRLQDLSGRQEPIRVLQVVSVMDRGGVETWLMHILRNIDRTRFAIDFLSQTTKPGNYDEEIRDLGCRIRPCLYPSRPWQYAVQLRKVLAGDVRYDVIHSHVHHYNGFILRVAKHSGVRSRIAHSHNDTSAVDESASWRRKVYLQTSKRWISQYASCRLAASRQAGVSLFGAHGPQNAWNILPYGLELSSFESAGDRSAIRSELGIAKDALVIGHVGRFFEQKNHQFLVRVAAQALARNKKLHFLLVGDGPLRAEIERQVESLDLTKHFSFLGVRTDISRLMLNAFDAFLFPSLYEGLGLVLVEAQAAGLPCLFSDCIPEEADIVPELVHRISLHRDASAWGDILLRVVETPQRPIPQPVALQMVQKSAFHIGASVQGLVKFYEGGRNNQWLQASPLV